MTIRGLLVQIGDLLWLLRWEGLGRVAVRLRSMVEEGNGDCHGDLAGVAGDFGLSDL